MMPYCVRSIKLPWLLQVKPTNTLRGLEMMVGILAVRPMCVVCLEVNSGVTGDSGHAAR